MNVLAGGPRPVAPHQRLAGAVLGGRVRGGGLFPGAVQRLRTVGNRPVGGRPAGFGNYHVPGAPQDFARAMPAGVHGAMDEGGELDQDQIMQRTQQAALQAKIAEIMGQMQGQPAFPQYATGDDRDLEGDIYDPRQVVRNTQSAQVSNLDALRQRFLAQLSGRT